MAGGQARAHQPVSIQDDFAIIGGGCLTRGFWLTRVKVVDGKIFFVAARTDLKFKAFLGGNFAVVDELINKRSQQVDACIAEASLEEAAENRSREFSGSGRSSF